MKNRRPCLGKEADRLAKINSSDIAAELATAMGLSKSAAKSYMDYIFGQIRTHAEAGDEVNIKMFGKFRMNVTAPRGGRNIKTKELMRTGAKHRLNFEMSRTLFQAYNGGAEEDGNEP